MTLKKPILFRTTFAEFTGTEVIGEGGTGIVYRAETSEGKSVAIKVLKPQAVTKERQKRFKNELSFGLNAKHKNVVTVLDHGSLDIQGQGIPFYVMPLYSHSLRKTMTTGIAPNEVLPQFAQILDGVEAAHLSQVVHRDLKPENILFDATAAQWVVADFGIAGFADDELYTAVETKADTRTGNFQYAAPEQRDRNRPIDVRADIFTLGMILHEMYTGVVPHGTGYRTIGSIAPDLQYLDDLVSTMIRNEPSNRPASIEIIKLQLIGRHNEFVERQRLSELKRTVVPTSDLDDSIVRDPVALVDVDWDQGILTLTLSQQVNSRWIDIFHLGRFHRTSVMGKGPEVFQFHGKKATIPVSSDDAQRVVEFFKQWLPGVHSQYVDSLTTFLREEENRKKAAVENEIRKIEEKRALMARLKI